MYGLKKEKSDLEVYIESMKTKAIETLVEKEKIILELQNTIDNQSQ